MKLEKIGRYEIKSELGRGGMATVYRGYDPRFEREVAIKVLPPEMLHADPQFRFRFEREAKIIAQLEHHSIVPVYDVGEENDQPYFVMRFMSGGSLSERIKKGLFSVEDATRIFDQIAPGLDEAHSKGIIHRDLKPGNILFDNKDVPNISDFGIAKITEGESHNVTGSGIIGTPAYMAPEQASGETIDGRADIYALGVLLYEMLTGRQPYEADTPMGVAIKHVTEPVPHILDANPTLPAWIEMVISTSMAKDRNDRFSTAVEMTETIKAFLRGEKPATTKNKNNKATLKVAPYNSKTAPTLAAVPKTVVGGRAAPQKRFSAWVVIVPLALIVLAAVGIGAFFILRNGFPTGVQAADTPAVIPPTAASPAEIPATEAPSNPIGSVTDTPAPVTDTPAASLLPVVGGADKVALLRSNDIWVMNVDGSDPQQVTTDGAAKFNLEWLPDGNTILYIAGKTIKTVDITTLREEIITNFSSSEYFESFHVSPDGTQAAISLARELHIVPFDLEKLKTVTKKSAVLAMEGCLYYKHQGVLDAIWSDDGQKLTIKYIAVSGTVAADSLRILDIHECNKVEPKGLDAFPLDRFTFSPTIVNFDWDGDLLFLMNSNKRNGGFGELGFYNTFTRKSALPLPIDHNCCYRDATFSPDGSYVMFAFQDIRKTDNKISLYYVPIDDLTTGGTLKPLALPDDFFTQRNEAPMPAFRPAR